MRTQAAEQKVLFQSFRDPLGKVVFAGERVLRVVDKTAQADLEKFLNSGVAKGLLEAGNLVHTKHLDLPPQVNGWREEDPNELHNKHAAKIIVEHEKIPFINYPYEWSPAMLHAAGGLTLDLAEKLLEQGMGIKDATPYNILFRGATPVFVDLLSFEARQPNDPVWMAYAQFVRTFLLPLLVYKHFGLPLNQSLLSRRDGLEPEEVYALCGTMKKFTPLFLELVSLPKWLTKTQKQEHRETYQPKKLANNEQAKFVLQSLFKRLRRTLDKLKPSETVSSKWNDYLTSNNNYSTEHFQAKERFVKESLAQHRPTRVLDVGCNTGHFSVIAAEQGASVVGLDSDSVVVDQLWRKASAEQLAILPLAIDLTRPTPAMGWRNRESFSFLERATGGFDAVLMLAVVHHMLVTERIPLPEILELAASLTRDLLIIEYVDPSDSMFRRLARGRESLYGDLNVTVFEETCRRKFEILRTQHLQDTNRWLYLLRRKHS